MVSNIKRSPLNKGQRVVKQATEKLDLCSGDEGITSCEYNIFFSYIQMNSKLTTILSTFLV